MAATYLTAAQLKTLRTEFMDDFIDLRPEWGSATAASAAQNATSIALTLLGAGTITAGTQFTVNHVSAGYFDYYVAADVAIVANAATVTFSPPLVDAVASGSLIKASPILKSLYNKRTRRLFFSDSYLQDLAVRTMEGSLGGWVQAARNPDSMMFLAIRAYGWRAMLADSEFIVTMSVDNVGQHLLDQKAKQLADDEGTVFFTTAGGPSSFQVYR